MNPLFFGSQFEVDLMNEAGDDSIRAVLRALDNQADIERSRRRTPAHAALVRAVLDRVVRKVKASGVGQRGAKKPKDGE